MQDVFSQKYLNVGRFKIERHVSDMNGCTFQLLHDCQSAGYHKIIFMYKMKTSIFSVLTRLSIV